MRHLHVSAGITASNKLFPLTSCLLFCRQTVFQGHIPDTFIHQHSHSRDVSPTDQVRHTRQPELVRHMNAYILAKSVNSLLQVRKWTKPGTISWITKHKATTGWNNSLCSVQARKRWCSGTLPHFPDTIAITTTSHLFTCHIPTLQGNFYKIPIEITEVDD
jgi:hypothetical protein